MIPNLDAATSFLSTIGDADLFSQCGQPAREEIDGVKFVPGWHEAAKMRLTPGPLLDVSGNSLNLLCARVVDRLGAEWYQENYNPVVIKIADKYPKNVTKAVQAIRRKHKIPKDLEIRVRNDIIGIAVEYAYEEVLNEGFYRRYLEKWYLSGRFPCAWKPKSRVPNPGYEGLAARSLEDVIGQGMFILL